MLATDTATNTTPRAWIGCLSCYNAGHLVGEWYDATEAAEVTPADVHGGDPVDESCEELWCFDHENIPVRGELDPMVAQDWGDAYEEAGTTLWPAVMAWAESGCHATVGDSDIPSIANFMERYCGEWSDFDEFAAEQLDQSGLLADVHEDIIRYFDVQAWTRDLAHDYTVERSPNWGVYVFRNP